MHWDPDRTLRLDGWAYVRGVDLTDTTPVHEAWLERLDKDQVLPVPVEHRLAPEATAAANDPNQRYDRAGFRLVIPADLLPAHGRWQLRLRVRVDGVERTGAVHALSRFGDLGPDPLLALGGRPDPVRIVPLLDEADGFVLQTRSDRFRAVRLGVEDDGSLTGTVRALAPLRSRPTEAVLTAGELQETAPVTVTEQGDLAFTLSPPAADRTFSLQVATEDGRRHRVAWPADTDTAGSIRGTGLNRGWSRTPARPGPGRSVTGALPGGPSRPRRW